MFRSDPPGGAQGATEGSGDSRVVRHGRLAFRVVPDPLVFRVERTGSPDASALKAHCLAIVAAAQAAGVDRLLVDERRMDGYTAGGLEALLVYREIAREAQERGLADRPMSIAVLTAPHAHHDHDFLAQSAAGIGFPMVYFTDEDEALAWLGVRR